MAPTRTFVLVGGGLAAARAAETLRKEGFDGRVVIVGDEAALPYERPPLSKEYLLGKKALEKVFVHNESWYADQEIELILATTVTDIDLAAHTVSLSDGARLTYDKALIATGAAPRRLSIPGADLAGIHYLRRIEDSDAIAAAIKEGGRFVIIGAGWIGLEVAAAAAGPAEVTVVAPNSVPLEAALGPEMGEVFAAAHRAHGVDLRMNTSVAELRGTRGRVEAVVTGAGATIPADVVIVGIGAIPNTDLAVRAGLPVSGGVVADAALRTENPDVYAVGDVANAYHPVLGKRIRVEHWANARNAPLVAARAMLGQDVSYDRMPYFYTDQYDLSMEYAGYAGPDGYDQVIFRGDVGKREFIAFWMSAGRVVAGMNVNIWDVTDAIQDLIRSGKTVDPARLADPAVPLDEAITVD